MQHIPTSNHITNPIPLLISTLTQVTQPKKKTNNEPTKKENSLSRFHPQLNHLSPSQPYSLLFSRNELDQGDVAHFNHEFLQSMGISIAKHRIEILKLAKKEKVLSPRKLLAAIHGIKRYISNIVHRDSSAIVVVPRATYYGGGFRKGSAMLRRSKRTALLLKHNRRMIIGGGEKGEKVEWDSMFKNLKPT